MSTDGYSTKPMIIDKGVIQGDCLSPLPVFNTLIKTIDHAKVCCMGYSSSKTLLPRHWFQFADDLVITTSIRKDNQLLLNVYNKWCKWTHLIICLNKCSTFGIKKNGNSSTQFKPYLKVNNEVIPPVKLKEIFTYLGKHFRIQ